MFKSRIMYLWFIFVSLIYLPSSRFCDFVGSFREKEEEERRNYRVHKTIFAIHIHDKLQRSKI
jgi:hypothetical protein